mgnify:CR=1 FL=1
MLKFTMVAIAILSLSSCKTMKGNLVLSEDTSFKRKTIFGNFKKIEIPKGSFKASLKVSGKDKLKLKLKEEDKTFKTIKFEAEGEIELPKTQGETTIRVDQLGTNYDLKVKVNTDFDSSTYDTTESCISGYRSEEVCRWVSSYTSCKSNKDVVRDRRDVNWDARRDNDNDTTVCHTVPGHTSCSIESIPIYGSQEVTYAQETTTRYLKAGLLLEGKKEVAKFSHSKSKTDRTRLSSSVCY